MQVDWKELLDPATTAVLVVECQEGVIGEGSALKGLVEAVRASGLAPRLARFLGFARTAGARIFHCTAEKRADGLGEAYNTPLTAYLHAKGKAIASGDDSSRIVPELAPDPRDILVPRLFGMTPFQNSDLDTYLRNLGVKTVLPTGVSVNIAITGTTIDAVSRGYRVAIATDCVAGTPKSYADAVTQNTLRNLAYLTTAEQAVSTWGLDWNQAD